MSETSTIGGRLGILFLELRFGDISMCMCTYDYARACMSVCACIGMCVYMCGGACECVWIHMCMSMLMYLCEYARACMGV